MHYYEEKLFRTIKVAPSATRVLFMIVKNNGKLFELKFMGIFIMKSKGVRR